ncbi:MAG: biotin--[acetyl-CoA-carboxylase] ligase [Treponema sp.]|jgi:BirA family biotin operon repressor/biotin-[acetyl-CoA-carboxylase] ligase|nr:biotin--[acetyl-CoA-carboxylase] ligase [Treponema sp.]
MTILKIKNSFNAPVYYEETVSSTMDVSRKLARENLPHGSVILADFQSAGRGRKDERRWEMKRGENLSFTVLLRYSCIEKIPSAITLRAGLAVCLAIEDFAPCLQSSCLVKWPNDILIKSASGEDYKKAVGILCEAEGGNVHLGIGVNTAQKEFPFHLLEKATSIALSAQRDISQDERFALLENILSRLCSELETADGETWKPRLEDRLYKKGEQVSFIEGVADSGKEIRGCLTGITNAGELLIVPDGEEQARSFITGELVMFKHYS